MYGWDVYAWLQQVDWPGNPPGAPLAPFANILDAFRGFDNETDQGTIGGGEGVLAVTLQAVTYQFADSALEIDVQAKRSAADGTQGTAMFLPNPPYDYSRITLAKLDATGDPGQLAIGARRFGRR